MAGSGGDQFRAVALGGKVSDQPLAGDSAARVVKRYASRVGLEASTFSGQTLRSGFLTTRRLRCAEQIGETF